MTEWHEMTVAECAAPERYATQIGPFGSALKADAYTAAGVPLLRGVNVNQGRFHDDDFVFIDEVDASRLSRYSCRPGDVLLVHRGTLGKIGLIPKRTKFPSYIMGNSMLRVRTDSTKLLPEYLYYWLTSPSGQHYLSSRTSQVGVPAIPQPLATLRQAVLPVPPLAEQRAITEMLGALDDKIESNRRVTNAIDRLMRVETEYAVETCIVDGTAKSVRLGDLVDQATLGVSPGEAVGRPYVGLEHMPRGRMFVDAWGIGDVVQSQKWRYEAGDILFGKLRPYFKKVGMAPLPGVCSTDILVLRPRRPDVLVPALVTLASQEVIDYASSASTGTKMPRASWAHLKAWRLDLPSDPALSALADVVKPVLELGTHLVLESRTLAALRDAVLPELLSGRLRVPKAREQVESVA